MLDRASDDDAIYKLHQQLSVQRSKSAQAGAVMRNALARAEEAEATLDAVRKGLALKPQVIPWALPKRTGGAGRATVVSILSDLHLDETVNPAEVGGSNAYSRAIATSRLRAYFEKAADLPGRFSSHSYTYEGFVLALGGDLVSGDIHEELKQTNESTVLEAVLYWSGQLAQGIQLLASAYPAVHVTSVAGNHGRRTPRERAKLRAKDNFDWLISQLVARETPDPDGKITWDIPEGPDATFSVYGHKYLLTHGNLGFGGGGANIFASITRGNVKRQGRNAAAGQPYDTLLCGHWHTYRVGPDFIVNGSLKGTDEYAWSNAFGLEPPIQALWVDTPEYGRSNLMPIYCAGDRKSEGW